MYNLQCIINDRTTRFHIKYGMKKDNLLFLSFHTSIPLYIHTSAVITGHISVSLTHECHPSSVSFQYLIQQVKTTMYKVQCIINGKRPDYFASHGMTVFCHCEGLQPCGNPHLFPYFILPIRKQVKFFNCGHATFEGEVVSFNPHGSRSSFLIKQGQIGLRD